MYDTTKPYTKNILSLIKPTWKRKFPSSASVDGIGTKGIYHWEQRSFRNATLDALAMNLNDMGVMSSKVRTLQDHIMLPEDDEEAIIEIVQVLSKECKKRDIEINAGETSIHRNLDGLEIGISVQGDYLTTKRNRFVRGDYLVGIGSNGLHSNGFTRVRELFGDEFRPEFIEPTFIYYDLILNLIAKREINGMVHVTGGAYTKLKNILEREDLVIQESFHPQPIFYDIYKRGLSDEEMYKTFNCGIGFVLGVSEKDSRKVIAQSNNHGFKAEVIGRVIDGKGKVRIKSAFSGRKIVL